MPNDVMMDVGGYQFSLSTAAYEEIKRAWAWRWQQHDVIGTQPFQDFVGAGHTELTISGYVTPHYKGGLRQVDAMVAEADRGEPLSVVDSLGYIYGAFVIVEVDEVRKEIGPAGQPLRIDFRMVLRSTDDDIGES